MQSIIRNPKKIWRFAKTSDYTTWRAICQAFMLLIFLPHTASKRLNDMRSEMSLVKVNTTTHKRYYISTYQNIKFLFPVGTDGTLNLKKQEDIVEAIETQFVRLDAAIKNLKTIKAKLKTYRKSVLKAAFDGKLVNVSDWTDIQIDDLGEVVTGTTPSKKKAEYYGDEYCFFKPTDLNASYYVKSSHDMLSRKGANEARLLPERSILVTSIGASIGKTGFNRVAGATNQQINAIVPDQTKYIPEVIYYIFISDCMQRQILENASSTTLPILNKSKFCKLKIRIPVKTEEQKRIVNVIESRFSVIDKVEQVIHASLNKAEKLRKSILKSAFEGKLVN